MDQELFGKLNEGTKVVGKDGKPLVVYHGSGTKIEEFDPDFTGKGNDQLGSGFYFSSNPNTAEAYTSRTRDADTPKLGGDDKPNVIRVNLDMSNPVMLGPDDSNLRHADIDVTQAQATVIITHSPIVMDPESSPLGDWYDEYWETGPTKEMISKVAENYTGASLIQLENDFFDGYATEYRKALNYALGYDGVIHKMSDEETHYVAWFPRQIHILK